MRENDFHIRLGAMPWISLLVAAFEKSFPLFRRSALGMAVHNGGKETIEKVLQTLKAFSTSFPQRSVDVEGQ